MGGVLAVLPIRSGSKRIKDKNIRIVGYYPLFYHSIATCLKVQDIDLVVVSVDCKKYKDIVLSYFCNEKRVVIIVRPASLATDSCKSEDVIYNAIEQLESRGLFFKYTVLVQATTPLTKASDISEALQVLKRSSSINSVLAASEGKRFYLDDSKVLFERPMTQAKTPKIYENGCFWCFDTNKFKEVNNRIIKPYQYFLIDEYDALDIDTYQDMHVVDMLLSRRVRESDNKYFDRREVDFNSTTDLYYENNIDPDGKVRNLLDEPQGRLDFAKDEITYINNKFLTDKNVQLLSVGCGSGYAESNFSNNITVHGIEPDLNACDKAKSLLDSVIHGNFSKEYYEEGFFDVIFCHHVIEHVKDPVNFLMDLNFVLKPGGLLIIGTPNFDGAMARRFGSKYRMLHDKTHTSLFSDFSMKIFLEDYGFLVEKIEYPYFETKYFNLDELKRLFSIEETSPPFYGNIFTVYGVKK